MDAKTRLTRNLVAESEAYGYTLTIWGAGAMLIDHYGTPGLLEVFLYVGGALLGFGALAAVAFENIETTPDEGRQQILVVSMIHVAATMGNLLVSFLLIRLVATYRVDNLWGFPVVGFQATVTYNLLLLLETFIAEELVETVPVGGDDGGEDDESG